jgi:hypothetical protein
MCGPFRSTLAADLGTVMVLGALPCHAGDTSVPNVHGANRAIDHLKTEAALAAPASGRMPGRCPAVGG